MKVLLVDDEADVCRLVKTMVEPLGVEVRTCSDSREAASILETEKFDGIMLDVAMPNLDGIELTRKIRTTPIPCDGHLKPERHSSLGSHFLAKRFTPSSARRGGYVGGTTAWRAGSSPHRRHLRTGRGKVHCDEYEYR
jgi:CheY-like chemotaxis protein